MHSETLTNNEARSYANALMLSAFQHNYGAIEHNWHTRDVFLKRAGHGAGALSVGANGECIGSDTASHDK